MIAPIRTLEDTIAWEVDRLGISRHDAACDWSGGYDVNDCALFQSTAVFGEKAAWNVDVFTTLPGGTYHAGNAGVQRGDVLLYGWTPGHFDHTEMALGAPAAGSVRTIGANGSDTIAVAYRTRSIGYVTGYFRPAYPGSSPSPASSTQPAASSNPAVFTPAAPAASSQGDDLMKIFKHGQAIWCMGPGFAHLLTAEEWAQMQTAGYAITYDFGDGPASQRAFDVVKAAHTQQSN